MIEKQKIYFLPGDSVTLKQDVSNKPNMYVVKKATKTITIPGGIVDKYFQGILCRWFDANMELREAVFNTKDLLKL